MMAAHSLTFILMPLMALLLTYFELWSERVFSAFSGDPSRYMTPIRNRLSADVY